MPLLFGKLFSYSVVKCFVNLKNRLKQVGNLLGQMSENLQKKKYNKIKANAAYTQKFKSIKVSQTFSNELIRKLQGC